MENTEAGKKLLRKFQVNPIAWVKARFGDNIIKAQIASGRVRDGIFVHTGKPVTTTGLSYQQEDVLRQWGYLIWCKLARAEGRKLTPEQDMVANKMGLSIQSSNGNGKDFIAALIHWHFIDLFSDCKILATANSREQLKTVLWSEVAKVRGLALRPTSDQPNELQTDFVMQAEMCYRRLPEKDDEGKRWFSALRTVNKKGTPEEQAETLAGLHEDHMLFLIDEASGLPDAVFKPIDRTLTGKLNICFMIFNPTQNHGFAIDSQGANKKMWLTVHWDAISCDNVDRSQIERLRQYGENSPAYRIGVLGLPPTSDSTTLIPHDKILAAFDREFELSDFDPTIGSVDAAGGGDLSVATAKRGPRVRQFEKRTPNADDLTDWSGQTLTEEEAVVAFVDNIGLGWYLPSALRKTPWNLDARPADFRTTEGLNIAEQKKFFNQRARCYWDLAQDFINGVIWIEGRPEDHQDLIHELGAIQIEYVGGKIKILDKKTLRKIIGFSPDHADSLALNYFKPARLFRRNNSKKKTNKIDYSKVLLR
jgi:hypothetical protein